MKEKLFYGVIIAMLVWIILSTMEVQLHNLDVDYIYSKANIWAILTTTETEMKVVDCTIDKPTDTWLVTVEDIRGNQYQYYDTEIQYNNWVKTCVMQGTKIIEIKE